ncbi:hypothetical protein POJ06DRAFT_242872 [Lipomyces tetrasporus]|uniref:Uncharacterized protein n=1 Tax=Lipomyces tetrasporus TaxID=54092 RepID=A0AAD7R131_9ASCO|nr:uncharacterized protein POJ06DRAFT_242872 [Lipomyces tetrasporus]KAJ8103817.1 hypothetical protein POJ06DRAFT_242872 [Lipomyces tetrasporus]
MSFSVVRVSKRIEIRIRTSTALISSLSSTFRQGLLLHHLNVRQCSTNRSGPPRSDDPTSRHVGRQSMQNMIEVLRSRCRNTTHAETCLEPPTSLLQINNDRKRSPVISLNVADNDVYFDPATCAIILDRLGLSEGNVMDIQIGTGRGIFDALSTSGLPNSEQFQVDNYDIAGDLVEHALSLYGRKRLSNVMLPSPAMYNRITEQLKSRFNVRGGEGQLDVVSFTSCFHHFAKMEHLRWIHGMLRPGGYAVMYWLYNPLLYPAPKTPILSRFRLTGKKIPGVQYPSRSKMVERRNELKLTLRRRLQDIPELERAALDERLMEITREFGEAYRTDPTSDVALQELMEIQVEAGDVETQMIRNSMTESAVNSGLNQLAPDDDDIHPSAWQSRMAETLGKYKESLLPSVSEGNWLSLLYHMENLWELSGLFRMPPESHSRTFSMRVDLRSVLHMWKEDPNFWHLDRQEGDNLLEELRALLEDSLDDKDLDEDGRVNMVFGSHITWLRKV